MDFYGLNWNLYENMFKDYCGDFFKYSCRFLELLLDFLYVFNVKKNPLGIFPENLSESFRMIRQKIFCSEISTKKSIFHQKKVFRNSASDSLLIFTWWTPNFSKVQSVNFSGYSCWIFLGSISMLITILCNKTPWRDFSWNFFTNILIGSSTL